jgi:hypothetical protein
VLRALRYARADFFIARVRVIAHRARRSRALQALMRGLRAPPKNRPGHKKTADKGGFSRFFSEVWQICHGFIVCMRFGRVPNAFLAPKNDSALRHKRRVAIAP